MPLPAHPAMPSNKHRAVDASFGAILREYFGIPTAFVLRALEGEPRQRAVALCRLATRYEEPNGTLLMLARKFGRGRVRRQRTVGTRCVGTGRYPGGHVPIRGGTAPAGILPRRERLPPRAGAAPFRTPATWKPWPRG